MSGRLKIIDLLEAERRAVLFLDEGNASCSQMAEGFASYLAPSSVRVFSAGLMPREIDELTYSVMRETGVEIRKARSKGLQDIDLQGIAVVISLCETERVPPLPAHIKHLPAPLRDPGGEDGSEDALLEAYRNSRNQVRELVSTLL